MTDKSGRCDNILFFFFLAIVLGSFPPRIPQVDAELMDACGEDLAQRLQHTMPNKILTVEATGLIPALSVARRLSIPVVFARKSRPITISESYQTMYHSKTRGTISELIVSTEYLKDGDRVLLIDDFLAGGYAHYTRANHFTTCN